MSKYREVVDLITPLMGKPFKLGGQSPEEGFDCLSFTKYVYEHIGYQFPAEFEGKNWGNYWEGWEESRDYSIMERFVMSLGRSIEPNYRRPLDLLVVAGTDGTIFPSILLLNQKATAVDRRIGVMIYPSQILRNIKAIRRIIETP